MKTLIYIICLFGMSSVFAATSTPTAPDTSKSTTTATAPQIAEEILHCPDDYDKIFMSFSISNSKSLGFSNIYYCVLKGVINTETGLRSIVKTIKSENKINGDVTPIYFQILKD